jgi:hypothetical protein
MQIPISRERQEEAAARTAVDAVRKASQDAGKAAQKAAFDEAWDASRGPAIETEWREALAKAKAADEVLHRDFIQEVWEGAHGRGTLVLIQREDAPRLARVIPFGNAPMDTPWNGAPYYATGLVRILTLINPKNWEAKEGGVLSDFGTPILPQKGYLEVGDTSPTRQELIPLIFGKNGDFRIADAGGVPTEAFLFLEPGDSWTCLRFGRDGNYRTVVILPSRRFAFLDPNEDLTGVYKNPNEIDERDEEETTGESATEEELEFLRNLD